MVVTPRVRSIAETGSGIRAMFKLGDELRAEGKNPVDLSLGNPDVPPPDEYYAVAIAILEEAREAAATGVNMHRYMDNRGFEDVRARVASDSAKLFGVPFTADDVLMASCSVGLNATLQTLVDPVIDHSTNGPRINAHAISQPHLTQWLYPNQVIYPVPGFVEYDEYIRKAQGLPVHVRTAQDFDLDVDAIREAITDRTKALIINSPNNPTGKVYSTERLEELATMLKDENGRRQVPIVVIEDAPYRDLVWSGTFDTMLRHYPFTVHVNSRSKGQGLAGERMGEMLVHPDIAQGEDKRTLHQALDIRARLEMINAPALQQRIVGRIGYQSGDVSQYGARVERLYHALDRAGFKLSRPEGAFYLFPRIPERFANYGDFKEWALDSDNPLLVVPGTAFGGGCLDAAHTRLAACVSDETIDRACERLKELE